jgi:hypothetical protein
VREGRRLIERSLKRESEREGKQEGAGRVRVKMVKKSEVKGQTDKGGQALNRRVKSRE